MNETQRNSLLRCINQHVPMPAEEFTALSDIFMPKTIPAQDYQEKPGADKSSLFLVATGLVRYFYLAVDGKEWNKAFVTEGSLSTSFSKDFLGRSSPYGIQALEDTEILLASYSEFESLFENYPLIERLGRKILQTILIFKMNRECSLLQDSAKTRYDEFVEENPMLLKRLPQYHIASYLGVTEASLSRLLRH